MSKEYVFFRFFVFVLVVFVLNFMILVSGGNNFYYWFLTSISLLIFLLIKERSKIEGLLYKPFSVRITRQSIFLLAFFVTYHKHYQVYRHLNTFWIMMLQALNVIFFFLVFCIDKRDDKLSDE
ncbi:hypothetical protein ACHRVZ_19680 [Flavobacterium sp. FlaQc-57]|uniref:hypothetical protein n=1 Tax=Flavobacterium sp. FlaQc-57 TaxID=3374186 RepID=UPI0037570D36